MVANIPNEERELLNRGVEWLGKVLPPTWSARRTTRTWPQPGVGPSESLADYAIDVSGPNGSSTIIVEAKRSLQPRDVDQMFADRLLYTFRAFTYHMPILVISEWLSPSTRERLEQQGVNYLDLTDNALIRLDNPALFIRSAGAARAPRSTSRGQVRLRGPKAARVVRLLLDVKPPYGLGDLALASDVAVSYVSRLLDSLSAGGAIERSRRGRVETVDIPRLLRRWADVYDVFATNEASTFLAPQGARECLERLRRAGVAKAAIVVTGSFAAVRVAPVAAPTLLTAYAQDVDAIAHDLGLLPADHGSNVVLLRPYDSVVWDRTTIENGLAYVSTSQAAIDCLTGNGRMPAEGEALVEWMVANESVWRRRSLAEGAPAGGLR